MDFTTWFRAWLSRHPLRPPMAHNRQQYTVEVMARVRELSSTPAVSSAPLRPPFVWGWPRLALSLATVAAGAVIAVGLTHRANEQRASHAAQDTMLLALLDQEPESLLGDDSDVLASDLETVDTMTLAESIPSEDETWLERTLEVLDQVDEDSGSHADPQDTSSSDDFIDELRLLDESELSSST